MIIKIYQCQSKKKGLFGPWLIYFFQKMYSRPESKRYSHYAMELVTSREFEVYESSFFGVRRTPRYRWVNHYSVVKSYEYNIEKFGQLHFHNWFYKYDGESYSILQLLGLVLKVGNFVKKNPWGAGASEIICNELVLLFLNHFVERVVGAGFEDSLDLLDTEEILETHSQRGLCKTSYTA